MYAFKLELLCMLLTRAVHGSGRSAGRIGLGWIELSHQILRGSSWVKFSLGSGWVGFRYRREPYFCNKE